MRFETEKEVKAWLRGLSLLHRDLSMKSEFYSDLLRQSKKIGGRGLKHAEYYLRQIERLHDRIKVLAEDVETALDTLDPEEKLVLTARYIKRIMWDAMEFHVHYSRRQAVRIHNRAIKNLVGCELKGDGYVRQ